MHELSIALSILDEIEKQMTLRHCANIEVVHLRIGVLSGVDPQALCFAYELAREGTPFAHSTLAIESVPLLLFCPQCNRTHTSDFQHIFCPRCLTPGQEIIEGRELEIRALELTE